MADNPNKEAKTDGLCITAIGMISALGRSVQACAAHRAGLIRMRPLSMAVSVEDEEYPEEIVGCVCEEAAPFEAFGRLAYLAKMAIEDLFDNYPPQRLAARRVGLFIAIPDDEERPLLNEYTLGFGSGATELFLANFSRLVSDVGTLQVKLVMQDSHAGALHCLKRAKAALERGEVDLCLVGAVDSYIDGAAQEWLYGSRQLKLPGGHDGLIPGEGAAFVVVERDSDVLHRGEQILARLGAVSIDHEERSYSDPDFVPAGTALYDVIVQTLSEDSIRLDESTFIVNDLNGQAIRAHEWGNVLIRLQPMVKQDQELVVWTPASSFGDVGATTGLFSLCLVIRAFLRGYSPTSQAVVCASSYSGTRGALAVTRP